MVMHLDNMTNHVELLTMPNGTQSFPARSCCDLREQYPDIPSGTYVQWQFKELLNECYTTQEHIGLIQMEGALLMPSKWTATMTMANVLLASTSMATNGYNIC